MQAAMAMEISAMRAPRYCALPWAPASGLYWARIRTASVYSACRDQEWELGLYWATMGTHQCKSACRHQEQNISGLYWARIGTAMVHSACRDHEGELG